MQLIGADKLDRWTKALVRSDAALWAESKIVLPGGERFSFRRHVYQIEPLSVWGVRETTRKGTQGGFTLAYILKTLWGLITGRLAQGAIYLFPTDDKVGLFSQSRFTPLIDANPYAIGRFIRRTNNVHLKQVGTAMLFFAGGQLPHRVGGIDPESIALRSDPADLIVLDEVDLMDPAVVAKARGRLGHSDLKLEIDLSNPTIPSYGIDASWQLGDQRHWMVRCGSCNEWWCLEIEFPQCLRRLADGRVIRACLKCGRELDIDQGEWVAKYPQRSRDHISRWWSQLNSHYVDPGLVLKEFQDPPEANLADVYRLRLGMPYLESQHAVTAEEVLLCCTATPPAAGSTVATALGVDVGRELYVVVGYRLGHDAYRVIAPLVLTGWEELLGVARAFNAEVTCIDNEPELHAARAYQGSGPGEIWLSDYVEQVQGAHYDAGSRVIRVNRNEILDHTGFVIHTAGRLQLPTPTHLVKNFAAHCASLAKVIRKEPGTGALKPVYLQRGPDHFRHAFANFLLAARRQTPVRSQAATTVVRPGSEFDLFG